MAKLKDQLKATRILENGIELYNIGYSSDAYMNFKQANVLSPNSAKNLYYLSSVEFDFKNFLGQFLIQPINVIVVFSSLYLFHC